jgi:hypothetical protein
MISPTLRLSGSLESLPLLPLEGCPGPDLVDVGGPDMVPACRGGSVKLSSGPPVR